MKSSCDTSREPGTIGLMCFGCCPPSERYWFKWVLLAQPVIAVALLALAHLRLL